MLKSLRKLKTVEALKTIGRRMKKKGGKLQIASLKYGVIEFYILKFQNLDFISDDI